MSRVMTSEQVREMLRSGGRTAGVRARARVRPRPDPNEMNKTEAAYAEFLRGRLDRHEIHWFRWAPFSVKLAKDLHYRPDFSYADLDGTLVIVDTKGAKKVRGVNGEPDRHEPFIEEDSWVKIKAAAEMFPFRFIVTWPIPGGWGVREVGA